MDMARRRIDLRLDEDFLARVDAEAKKLGQTRTKFVERALESALGNSSMGVPDSRDPGLRRETADLPASSRASGEELQGLKNIAGMATARELAMERQRKLNERKP